MNEEKKTKTYWKKIKWHIEKNKRFYIWLLIFLILPLFIECMIYFIEKGLKIEFIQGFKKVFYILRDYKSYYATILTLSFAIFSYNKQQEKLLEERQKENELREKELEDKKDYYRPIFVVEENSESNRRIILLMKDKSLYLTKVKVYVDNINVVYEPILKITTPEGDSESFKLPSSLVHRYEQVNNKYEIKSGELIAKCNFNKFYITAETLIGETILFGYFSPTKKFYKYLKENQNPKFPNMFSQNELDKNKVENIWGDFNKIINNTPDYLDNFFFQDSQTIREIIGKDFYIYFKSSLNAETHSDFLKNIFQDIKKAYLSEFKVDKDSLLDMLIMYINYIDTIRDKLLVNSQDEKKVKDIQEQLLNKISKELTFNSPELWEWITDRFENLKDLEDNEADGKLLKILDILIEIFNILEVNLSEENFLEEVYLWKSNIIYIKYKIR